MRRVYQQPSGGLMNDKAATETAPPLKHEVAIPYELQRCLKSAEQGAAKSQYLLGWLWEEGRWRDELSSPEVDPNHEEAVKWYQKAAEQGYVRAQFALGWLYKKPGVRQNYKAAAKWFLKAANQGYVPAQYYLSQLYESGLGVKKDLEAAESWWLKIAEQGDQGAYELDRINETFDESNPCREI